MRTPLFRLGFTLFSSALVVTAVACGGGGAKEGAGPNTPASSSKPADSEPSSGASSSGDGTTGASGTGTGGSTTTTQLGDGGDLQGAKLGGSVHTTNESKGDAGPKSTHGGSASEPGRAAKDIQAIVVARRDDARACYDKSLAAHPGIEGDLDIKWVIDPQGNVTEPSVDTTKSQILEPDVGACIIEIIKKIKFHPSEKGYETRAHYPFNFHPKASSTRDAGK